MTPEEGQNIMTTIERLPKKAPVDIDCVTPADWVAGPRQGEWTYEDYYNLDDGQRYEIVRGVLLMSPSPIPEHQRIAGRIFYYLVTHVDLAGRGRVYHETDVFFKEKEVLRPDVSVILNAHLKKIEKLNIHGAPDLVVEVASPGTATYDQFTKYDIYAHYGVPEYWIVRPLAKTVELFLLEHGIYHPLGVFKGKDMLPSKIVPDLPVRVEQFFPETVEQ